MNILRRLRLNNQFSIYFQASKKLQIPLSSRLKKMFAKHAIFQFGFWSLLIAIHYAALIICYPGCSLPLQKKIKTKGISIFLRYYSFSIESLKDYNNFKSLIRKLSFILSYSSNNNVCNEEIILTVNTLISKIITEIHLVKIMLRIIQIGNY